MADTQKTVFLFPASSHAIRAERFFQEAGLDAKLIPVPRHLSSDCGLCVRLPRAQRERAEAVAAERKMVIEGIHNLD